MRSRPGEVKRAVHGYMAPVPTPNATGRLDASPSVAYTGRHDQYVRRARSHLYDRFGRCSIQLELQVQRTQSLPHRPGDVFLFGGLYSGNYRISPPVPRADLQPGGAAARRCLRDQHVPGPAIVLFGSPASAAEHQLVDQFSPACWFPSASASWFTGKPWNSKRSSESH